jgi:hypothetical protein
MKKRKAYREEKPARSPAGTSTVHPTKQHTWAGARAAQYDRKKRIYNYIILVVGVQQGEKGTWGWEEE